VERKPSLLTPSRPPFPRSFISFDRSSPQSDWFSFSRGAYHLPVRVTAPGFFEGWGPFSNSRVPFHHHARVFFSPRACTPLAGFPPVRVAFFSFLFFFSEVVKDVPPPFRPKCRHPDPHFELFFQGGAQGNALFSSRYSRFFQRCQFFS